MLLLSQPDPVPSSLIKLNQAGKLLAAQPIPNVTVTVTLCPITQPKCYMLQLQLHFAPFRPHFSQYSITPSLHHPNPPMLRLRLRFVTAFVTTSTPKIPRVYRGCYDVTTPAPPKPPPLPLRLVSCLRSWPLSFSMRAP